MASSTEFLSGQVDAYADSWKADHRQAIECWELQERIEVGLALYHYIHSVDERWSDAVRAGAAAVDDAESRSILELCRRWLGPAEKVLASTKILESQGYSVNGSRPFRDAWHRVRTATMLDAAEMRAAYDELDAGKGRPLGEVVLMRIIFVSPRFLFHRHSTRRLDRDVVSPIFSCNERRSCYSVMTNL